MRPTQTGDEASLVAFSPCSFDLLTRFLVSKPATSYLRSSERPFWSTRVSGVWAVMRSSPVVNKVHILI